MDACVLVYACTRAIEKSTDNASFYSMFDRHCCTLSIDKVTERRAQWNKYTKQTRQSLWKLNWLFVDVELTKFSVDFSLCVFLWLFLLRLPFFTVEQKFCFRQNSNWYTQMSFSRKCVHSLCLYVLYVCTIVQSTATSNDEIFQASVSWFRFIVGITKWCLCFLELLFSSLFSNFFLSFKISRPKKRARAKIMC